MTTNVRLSKLERVNLRDVWQNEATGFTRWLVRVRNGDADNILYALRRQPLLSAVASRI